MACGQVGALLVRRVRIPSEDRQHHEEADHVGDGDVPAAGVRRRDDRHEVADMDLAAEHMARHRAADQRGRDVVEEAGQHEHDREQDQSVRQEGRHRVRDAAVFEVARQDRGAHQQQEQVREDHPFVPHVQREAGEPGTGLEPP
jgi:hypothetical protein